MCKHLSRRTLGDGDDRMAQLALGALPKTFAGITRRERQSHLRSERNLGVFLGLCWAPPQGHARMRALFALPGIGGGNATGCKDLIKPEHGLYLHCQV